MKIPSIRAAILFGLLALLLPGNSGPNQPRLIVDNRTGGRATVQAWRYTGDRWDWHTVADVVPQTWVAVLQVKENDRFRALAGSGPAQTHTVSFYMDRTYNGPQDIWLLR